MSLPRPAAGGESCKQDSFLHNRKLRHSVVENQQELQSNSWGVGRWANSFL